MRGSGYDDQKAPSGPTTDQNFMEQPDGVRRWWLRLYYGIDTADIEEAKAYAFEWRRVLNPSAKNHGDVVKEYNEGMLKEAHIRFQDNRASAQEQILVRHDLGEESGAESLGMSNSS